MSKFLYTLLLTFFVYQANAQLCTGSLGDPIVNITFGAGANPGAPLAAAATGYAYRSTDCPDDGFYTVRSNTSSCFGNSWHSLANDHTGNPNGYFMLINASLQPSAFYIDTVKGLCGNSTYEFAAWILNVILPSACNGASTMPNLTFTIERTNGTVLQTYNSSNIPPTGTPTWKQYGFFFTTPPAGADIVLRIVNNAPGGCGNDLALDDITFRPCGPQIISSITGQTTSIANICEGTARTFTLSATVSGGFTNPAFQWQQRFNGGVWTDIAGANSTSLVRSFVNTAAIGNYEYRLSVAEAGNLGSAQCRISSQPVAVVVNANPVATATNNGPACVGSNITLTATGGTQYNWSGPGGFTASSAMPVISNIQPSQAGSYTLVATSAAGCFANASTTVVVNPVPTATATATASICSRDSVLLTATGGTGYEWQPSTGLSSTLIATPKASPAATTTYSVIVSNSFGCKDTATSVVTVFEKAFANAGPDKFFVKGQSVSLSGSITGRYQSFAWSPTQYMSNTQSLQPIVNPPGDAEYELLVVSNNNCGVSKDTVLVKYYQGIYIPNAFTPNGDAINPTWSIPALNAFPGFELTVFNRYGQVVFRTTNANIAWNGKFKGQDVEPGVYTYLIDLKKAPGILKGTVMVLR